MVDSNILFGILKKKYPDFTTTSEISQQYGFDKSRVCHQINSMASRLEFGDARILNNHWPMQTFRLKKKVV